VTRAFVGADSGDARDALAATVGAAPDIELVGAAGVEEALARVDSMDAVIAIIDAADLEAASGALESRAAVVLLADAPHDAVAELLRAGAAAVLPRDADAGAVAAAVRAAAAGLVTVMRDSAPALAAASSGRTWPGEDESSTHLSPREREVLRLLSAGTGNKGIARRLGISEHTVKFHVASILAKMHASSRTEAVTEGIRRGIVML
jgi:DNA-binding NarL/FixJ family response regulator